MPKYKKQNKEVQKILSLFKSLSPKNRQYVLGLILKIGVNKSNNEMEIEG